MRGDVAQAFGLAGFATEGGRYVPTISDRVDDEDLDWHGQAACSPANKPETMTLTAWVNQFYPERGVPHRPILEAFCNSCPVRSDCAQAGAGEKHGIWGGTSERKRRGKRKTGPGAYLGPERKQKIIDLARTGLSDAKIADEVRASIPTVLAVRRAAGIWKDRHGHVVANGQVVA